MLVESPWLAMNVTNPCLPARKKEALAFFGGVVSLLLEFSPRRRFQAGLLLLDFGAGTRLGCLTRHLFLV